MRQACDDKQQPTSNRPTEADTMHGSSSTSSVTLVNTVKHATLHDGGMSASEYRSALRRIDWHMLPYTFMIFLCSQVDKHNLGQAHARDLDQDLHLKGNQYSLLLSLYFPAYLLLHYVAGIFLRQLRPRLFIPATIVCCGLTTLSMCRATGFTYMAAGRLLLGIFEGALTPCITILYASWYPIEHISMRLMILHLASPFAGLLGAFICAGFFLIDGVRQMEGWQWMFLCEGLFTVCIAVPGFWLLPNFFEQDGKAATKLWRGTRHLDRWWQRCFVVVGGGKRACKVALPSKVLRGDQHAAWQLMLQREAGPLRRLTPFSWRQVLRPFVDVKVLLYTLIALSSQVAASNMSNFAPMILRGMGYVGAAANLYSAGPLALTVVVMLLGGLLADKRRMRGPLLLPCLLLVALGQTLIVINVNTRITYAATYLVTGFSGPISSLLTAWCAANVGAQYTKMATMALVMLAHTTATLISVNIFPPDDAPLFKRAHVIGLVAILVACVATAVLMLLLRRDNRRREKAFRLRDLDAQTLAAAMQIHRPADAPVDDVDDDKESGTRTDDDDSVHHDANYVAPMSDDEARVFWNVAHLTNLQFAQLGDRHPGVRYVL